MTTDLPAGYGVSAPAASDAEAIFALVRAYNERVVGVADTTLDDIRDDLVRPGFDPACDGWLVHDAAGTLVGYGWSLSEDAGATLDLDVIASDQAAARWLLGTGLEHAVEVAQAGGEPQVVVSSGVYRDDTDMRALLAELGFAPATTFHRMRVDHTRPVPVPDTPAGVVLRKGPGDETLRRDAHAVVNRAFTEHFGETATSFERWAERMQAAVTSDWGQLLVSYLDDRPVGMLLGNDQFVEDEHCGYVRTVGVVPEARGRGIARHLLQVALARDAAAGRKGTLLHVDTNNTTPALGLYESVGMRAVLVIDIWQRTLVTTTTSRPG